MTTTPRAEVQTLTPGALVQFFELDATGIGGEVTYWSPFLNRMGTSLVFQGRAYSPFPIEAVGFERSTDGALPRPRLRVSNVNGLLGALCLQYADLVGAIVTRRQTLEKFLDALNFPNGINPTAGAYEYPPETWIIEQKTAETQEAIEWELVAACDATGLRLPARKMQPNTCAWTKPNDPEAGNCPHVLTCGRQIADCKGFWGEHADLPFGGFPGLLMVRQ